VTVRVGPAEPLALLELRTGDGPAVTWRYQHADPSGSIRLETDTDGALLTFEEFAPYGSSAYRAAADVTQPPKRYRFGACDRDQDIGWDYRGARYYVASVARWANPDPGGMLDGTNRYWFVRANPVRHHDPTGLSAIDSTTGKPVDPRAGTVLAQTAPKPVGMPTPIGHWKCVPNLVAQYRPAAPARPAPPNCEPGYEPRWFEPNPGLPDPPVPPSKPPPRKSPPKAQTPKTPDPKPPEQHHEPPPHEPEKPSPPPSPPPPQPDPPPPTPEPPPSPNPPPGNSLEGRSWWSRGGTTAVFGGIALGVGVALMFTPIGWAGAIVAGMAIGSGGFGLAEGIWQVETSEQRTAEQDAELNHRVGVAMTMFGSPGGLAGGAVGYLVAGEEGMETGAAVGAIAEGIYGLRNVPKGLMSLAEGREAARAAERAEWAARFAARPKTVAPLAAAAKAAPVLGEAAAPVAAAAEASQGGHALASMPEPLASFEPPGGGPGGPVGTAGGPAGAPAGPSGNPFNSKGPWWTQPGIAPGGIGIGTRDCAFRVLGRLLGKTPEEAAELTKAIFGGVKAGQKGTWPSQLDTALKALGFVKNEKDAAKVFMTVAEAEQWMRSQKAGTRFVVGFYWPDGSAHVISGNRSWAGGALNFVDRQVGGAGMVSSSLPSKANTVFVWALERVRISTPLLP
jgi:RHS repeat-associated protein